jgi:phage FluMu protein gp41
MFLARRTLLSIPDVSGYLSTRSSGYLTARSSAVIKSYVQRLDVCYGDNVADMPHDSIREIHNLDSEIMFHEGGK